MNIQQALHLIAIQVQAVIPQPLNLTEDQRKISEAMALIIEETRQAAIYKKAFEACVCDCMADSRVFDTIFEELAQSYLDDAEREIAKEATSSSGRNSPAGKRPDAII